jgi:hypothetical protein
MISELTDIPAVADYLKRIGAKPRSLRVAVVEEKRGKYWKDLAVIRFGKDGTVNAPPDYMPDENEAAQIAGACKATQWPEHTTIANIVNPPDEIKNAKPAELFEFRDKAGQLVMVQVRREVDGGKVYLPWTYWSDGRWRRMEPEGALPLFNADRLRDANTVFIHEGAKAARYVQWMVDGKTVSARKALEAHPWGRELKHAVHLGWIGGALSPRRTDWSAIAEAGIKKAFVVADNDAAGKSAVPAISEQIRVPTYVVQFTDEWPASFDLADPFPDTMFGEVAGARFYNGPSFQACLHPATWATDLVKPEKGRPYAVLRDSFKGAWAYVEEIDQFVCREMPTVMRSAAILNNMLAPFSHAAETTKLIVKAYREKMVKVCYRPDHAGTLVTFKDTSAINLHVPGTLRSREGDPAPWLEYLDYMFVRAGERKHVERWCATLIARPEVRMSYGLLLISEAQGVGKTTLGAQILAPLVGHHNVGHAGEKDILSDFNDWVALKRLVLIQEIYSGASWKAYHTLKGIITDRDITVNQKYQRAYNIENWAHVVACSNSMRALKMENDDRRWFYPAVTEKRWPKAKFEAFYDWLNSGGLQIIKHWAEQYGDYVQTSDRAPMTDRKREMIDGSRSEAQREAVAIAEAVREVEAPVTIVLKDVIHWCREHAQGRVFESDYEIKRTMTEVGLHAIDRRVKVGPRLEYLLVNDKMLEHIAAAKDDELPAMLRAHIKKCTDLMEGVRL